MTVFDTGDSATDDAADPTVPKFIAGADHVVRSVLDMAVGDLVAWFPDESRDGVICTISRPDRYVTLVTDSDGRAFAVYTRDLVTGFGAASDA